MIGSFLVSFALSFFTQQKIFLLIGFLVLMFMGVMIQSSGGLLIESRPVASDDGWSYENVVVTLDEPLLYLFSQLAFWIGLVVSAWLGLVTAFDFFGNRTRSGSPFSF